MYTPPCEVRSDRNNTLRPPSTSWRVIFWLFEVTLSPLGSIQVRVVGPLLTTKQVILRSSPASGVVEDNPILMFCITAAVRMQHKTRVVQFQNELEILLTLYDERMCERGVYLYPACKGLCVPCCVGGGQRSNEVVSKKEPLHLWKSTSPTPSTAQGTHCMLCLHEKIL